ncbi:MAG: DUF348 domain-containing protein [Anaerolineales bacterium]|nr:DUF348 domain-containing protein [Anaerolineales bacterium]
MKGTLWVTLVFVCLFSACAAANPSASFTIIDGEDVITLQSSERTPAGLLAQAGLEFSPADRVLYHGLPVPMDQPLPNASSHTLQLRRARDMILYANGGQQIIQTSARTVGEALTENGFQLKASDRVEPPANTILSSPLTVTYSQAKPYSVQVGDQVISILSSAETVSEALAEAGLPLVGLDISQPGEDEGLPEDGRIRVIRVQENIQLTQKVLPYDTEYVASDEVELDLEQVLQPGQPGLSISRVRIRYEDGQEVSRETESENLVRPPQTRIVGYGTKIVSKTLDIPGGQVSYWRAVQMYATSYSPCNSGADRCYPGTASGKPVQKGVVAVTYDMYQAMQGQAVYIPGYGLATIEDVGGGIPGKLWIDLGYSDEEWVSWSEWVTVYFLEPAPAGPYVFP